MELRGLLFTADGGVADPVGEVLAALEIEVDYCPETADAIEKLAAEKYQLVILDWDQQPQASELLDAARQRKPAERPLCLAIVGDDQSVPKALQAGANSVLRKPILINQAKDTLTTARDLLRAKEAKPQVNLQSMPVVPESDEERSLRAGEFLQSAPAAPGAQFDTEQDAAAIPTSSDDSVRPLKDLEPMAASVAEQPPPPPPAPVDDEPRGLEWYLRQRGVKPAPTPEPVLKPIKAAQPELLGYEQSSDHMQEGGVLGLNAPPPSSHEQTQTEPASEEEGEFVEPRPRPSFARRAITWAAVLAACGIIAAPQAPWHRQVRSLWGRGQQSLHAWLNPQVATPAQAPVTHENFGQAGDEYKLPAAENIPDATTDPSQIQVVPVVDPTAKKPNGDSTSTGQAPADATATPATNANAASTQSTGTQPSATQPNPAPSNAIQPMPSATSFPTMTNAAVTNATPAPTNVSTATTRAAAAITPALSSPMASPPLTAPPSMPASTPVFPTATPVKSSAQYDQSQSKIPSSLRSQLAPQTPPPAPSNPADTTLPSIEPVSVTETTERLLLADQPLPAYPANGHGQQGTAVVQVLIGRDGTVQDAKFLQGSLAFARAAIDGVRQWKFKPYMLNGRPVSVQTQMTLSFKPGQ